MFRWIILERVLVDSIGCLNDPLRQDKLKNELLRKALAHMWELKRACEHLPSKITDDIQDYFSYLFLMLDKKQPLTWRDFNYQHKKLSPYQLGLIRRLGREVMEMILFDQ